MDHIRSQLLDESDLISSYLIDLGMLRNPDNVDGLTEAVKAHILNQFLGKLISRYTLYLPPGVEQDAFGGPFPLTLTLPGWTGNFSEDIGKRVMVVGPTPIVSRDNLEISYNIHGEARPWDHFNSDPCSPLISYVTELHSTLFNGPPELALADIYLTHIFPVGTRFLKEVRAAKSGLSKAMMTPWSDLRAAYARDHLPVEIHAVKPQVIIALGREAFYEMKSVLSTTNMSEYQIRSWNGKSQLVRAMSWGDIRIVGVPHVGSSRERMFWRRNIVEIGKAVAAAIR